MPMESLYKSRGKFGLLDKEKRKESNKLRSQAKRQSIIAARRNMPLGDLNGSMERRGSPIKQHGKAVFGKAVLKPKSSDRLERLREWQKVREEAKSKASKKKPVFSIRQSECVPSKTGSITKPQFSFSIKKAESVGSPKASANKAVLSSQPVKKAPKPTSYSTKKAILCMSPKPAHQAPASRVTRPGNANKPNAPAPVPKPVERKAGEITGRKNAAVKKSASSSKPKPAQGAVPARSSTRLASKITLPSAAKQAAAPTKPRAPSTRSSKTTVATKGAASGKSTGKATSKKAKPKASKKTISVEKTAPSGKENGQLPEQDEYSDVGPVDDSLPLAPTTPKKSYQPVHPSPLLNCRSASRHQPHEYVDDPAWIPGAPAPELASGQGFEGAFDATFSPFRFTAGSNLGQEYQFNFCMELKDTAECATSMSPDSISSDHSVHEPNSASTSSDGVSTSGMVTNNSPDISSGPTSGTEDLITSNSHDISSGPTSGTEDLITNNSHDISSGPTGGTEDLITNNSHDISSDPTSGTEDLITNNSHDISSGAPSSGTEDLITSNSHDISSGAPSSGTEDLITSNSHDISSGAPSSGTEDLMTSNSHDISSGAPSSVTEDLMTNNSHDISSGAPSSVTEDLITNSSHAISDSALTSGMEDLMTFSDTSDCSMAEDSTPKLRRSNRNIARKSYSSARKQRKPVVSTLEDVAGLSPKSAKKNPKSLLSSSSEEDMSGGTTSLLEDTPTKARSVRKSTRKSRRSSRRVSTLGVEMMGEGVVRNLEGDFAKENSGVGEVVDFRQLHSDVCAQLLSLSEEWEEKEKILEHTSEDIPNREEVLGQVRSTCCKARLMLGKKSKLTQFIGLVDMAESGGGERKTTAQDLMGFWDMVYYAVTGLYRVFDELTDMERGGWQVRSPSPKKQKLQKRGKKGKKPCKAETAEPSERVLAARRKREADRAKLRELLKMNSAQQAGKENLLAN